MDDPANLGALVDLLPEALLVVNARGVVRRANGAAARLLGRPAQALAGSALAERVDGGAEQLADLLVQFGRSRSFAPASLVLRDGTGEAVPVRCEGALLRPASADREALLVLRCIPRAAAGDRFRVLNERIEQLSREIRRRRLAEADLHQSREWYRVTLHSIGDAVIVTDAEGRVSFMNPVAEALTGWPLADCTGRHLDEIFVIINDSSRAPVESPVAQVLRRGVVVGLANHTLLVRRNGEELPIDDSGAPIRAGDGTLLGVVLVFRDLSERYGLERELLRQTQRLEEADRRKDEFLSMLAHELRNPLAPLRSGVHLLATRSAEATVVQRIAGAMTRQVDHVVRLVDDLLDVARLTRGAIRVERTPILLREVVEQAADMARPTMAARGLRFSVTPPPESARVDGDHTRLVQALDNLLANAAKFTPPGGSVDLGAAVVGAEAVITVIDTGQGVAPALLPRVFELFVQGEHALDKANSGLGIGLSIAQAIVRLHEGEIEASSRGPGQGSEFVLRLPLVAA
ncbi:sensor histidine kinase [Ramlibacter rhizophilus]|uniref:histidine kinase n=1 Tax=Ramlibacter rhizophilus TaxID=1781167 RepID=A0A4Z0C1G0_9BURK|nr:PAS domain-containing sensor histidine kinase [Ramlibacter rhizophilus]TFZ04358.1 PAS domain-containing sensor histidine kinase [Ramlibacter rhizophilus]